jgi:hypothetical protein
LHTLLGSVAEKVIRYSKIPVLVTTPPSKSWFSYFLHSRIWFDILKSGIFIMKVL